MAAFLILSRCFATCTLSQTSAQGSSDYFLDSADRVHFFAEKGALAKDGGVKTSEKLLALNKAGHGLHVCDDLFREYSTSDKVSELNGGSDCDAIHLAE